MHTKQLVTALFAAFLGAGLIGAVLGCSPTEGGSGGGMGGTTALGGATATGGSTAGRGGAAGMAASATGGNAGAGTKATGGNAGAGTKATGGVAGQGATPPAAGGAGGAPDPYPLPTAPKVDLSGAGKWSDPATWGGHPPAPGADVTIPAKRVVLLDTAANVGQLEIDGTLACDPAMDASLTAKGIMVMGGTLACGSQAAPYTHHFTITLNAAPSGPVVKNMVPDPEQANGIVVMSGGLLELFGEPRRGWTQLAKTAKAGDTTLSLLDPLSFRAGDHVVVASTDFDPAQTEEVVVASVSGPTLTLAKPLAYMHWGQLQMYPSTVPEVPSVVDERAEVGLLTRNILIQGDPSTESTGFGAHVMTMIGSKMYVQGVELYRAGQLSVLARYPLHWHLVADATGQFIADTSIHHSFNRCVTIHGTQNATVLRNVCYDHVGHGYFLEDGVETGNLLAFNLGLSTHSPAPGKEVLLSDRSDLSVDAVGMRAGPSTFWVSNGNNTVVGNHAAGSDGSGYWYPNKPHPTGPSQSNPAYANVVPSDAPVKQFSGDVAHSCLGIGLLVGEDQEQDGLEAGFYGTKGTSIFDTFTAYKIFRETGGQGGAVWLRGGTGVEFHNMVTADAGHGYNFSYDALLEGALLVGQSANIGNPSSDEDKKAGRTSPWHEEVGFGLYDGPHHLKNAYFAGFKPNPYGPDPGGLDMTAAITEVDGVYSAPNHHLEGVAFAADTVKYDWGHDSQGNNVAVLDMDGSLTGHAGWYVTGRNPTMRDSSCVQLQTTPNAVYGCPHTEVNVSFNDVASGPRNGTLVRDDGAQSPAGGYGDENMLAGYSYQLTYSNYDVPTTFTLDFYGELETGEWLSVELPITWGKVFVYPNNGPSDSAHLVAAQSDVNALNSALNAGGTGYAPSGHGFTFKLVATSKNNYLGYRVCQNAGCK